MAKNTHAYEPARTLKEVMRVFDPNRTVDPRSSFYVRRPDLGLRKLSFKLGDSESPLYAFLCGHRGSGKTTELKRLLATQEISERYQTVYLTATTFGDDPVYLTHDALLLEIGFALAEQGKGRRLGKDFGEELHQWGQEIVKTYFHDEAVEAAVGAKASAWLAFFKAQLKARREWKTKQRQILEPKVQDLVGIVNRLGQALENEVGKRLLVVVDDLEKGESEAHKEMHTRIFQEHYEILTQPRFSIVYTIPVYFRALPERRVPSSQLFAFPALRLYKKEEEYRARPPLSRDLEGYQVMRSFVMQRLAEPEAMLSDTLLEELLLIGGGIFRETARAVSDATLLAHLRGAERIEQGDVEQTFHGIKKEYQPLIRGAEIGILKEVLDSSGGWVPLVEPHLQSHAVVEYENDELWLDLRYVLKEYVRQLAEKNE